MATLFDTPINLFPLRQRQEAALDGIRQAIREGHRRMILFGPTGFGKTVIMAHLAAGALRKGNKSLITVPRLSLVGQTALRFESQGIHDIGFIQGRHERTNQFAGVQIASVQTLIRRPVPEIDFCIVDEAHIQYDAFNDLLDSEDWKEKIVIGVTATPWVKGMGRRWTKLIVSATTQELITEGCLTPIVAYGVPDGYNPDRSKVHTNFDGEYVESEAEEVMSTAPIVGNVVATWKAKGPDGSGEHSGDRTFLFCVNRSHARRMQEKFEEDGIPCGYIDGTMDADARKRVFEKYRSGEIKVLASVDTVGIGVDEDVRCISYCRLTKSEIKFVQDIGRGLRLATGKQSLLLLDHCGSCEALGLPTDIHHDALDMRDPDAKGEAFQGDKKPPKPHKCPKCNAIVPRSAKVCPICHSVINVAKGPRVVDGELVRFGSRKPKDKQQKPELPRAAWYGGFLWIAKERGRSEGWAAHRYKEKFGNWPNGMAKVPIPPHPEVVRFDKYCRIRYAKSKQSETRKEVPVAAEA